MLCAITMMYIPIKDQYFIQLILSLQIVSKDGNVIKKTKTKRLILFGMMAGRSD